MTYTGYGSKPYASKAEAAVSFDLASLGCFSADDSFYPATFTDAVGASFRAKPDFWSPGCELWLEFKTAPLNGVKTKASAEKQIADRLEYRNRKGQPLLTVDMLKYQWNHARRKQAIVQQTLSPENFIVVFKDSPTVADAADYLKADLAFVPMSALPSYLGCMKLAKRGLAVSFHLQYHLEGVDDAMGFSIGPFDKAELVKQFREI